MESDRLFILVENENRVDVSIWWKFDFDLTLDFGYTTLKQQILSSADIGIGHEVNIDIRCWIDIEFWSHDIATKM